MSNKYSQQEINEYLSNRDQYKQNYLINRKKNIDMRILYVNQQNYLKKNNFKNRILNDMYLGNSKLLKRTFNYDSNWIPSVIHFFKNIN